MVANKKQKRILIIDDEENMRHMLQTMLTRYGYSIFTAKDGADGLEKITDDQFDFVLCDVKMPRMNGMEFLKAGRDRLFSTTVIMMSAFGSIDMAIEAMKLGAYDFVSKPFKNEEIRLTIKKAEERERLTKENIELKDRIRRIGGSLSFGNMVGRSPIIQTVFSVALKVARFDSTVLITGESGTGKELVAQGIHRESDRRSSPMVPVNCASIPESLMESELFGHVKGAFTGADKDKKGLFEIAEGGTLFLDEIGDIPVSLQPKLLRVLQESEIRPVGGGQSRAVDIRVIAATSKDLEKEMASGHFREDLFYRLNVVPITLPPLRHRPEDIPLLCKFFINRFNKSLGSSIMNISSAVMTGLMQHDWPGNIRELENAIERAIVLADGSTLELENFVFGKGGASNPDPTGSGYDGFSLKAAKAELEDKMIRKALTATGGNRTHAANMLEISHPSLLSKIKLYGIEK
ncbi:sigma-54 dependent transcriptional regulator [Desulfosarcina sp.]|uniref:sigma-54-dependent transcriptional regulator n=1 Tax=Desulfosarcina sp. TaxID=2027861 RepID=UPI0029A84D19|nr:sigma-54 dependent transcriptional regulator [Desulfosarcina sp.]MDX2454749.1 sigma-54 dependent transcriptional regulator [Desulfosarcina sp.]MDX2492357.1 sigma-54 dependent transcriptional regulator [Desulfosarcina sp.]